MPASSAYTRLAGALRARLDAIADRDLYARDPAAHLEKLRAASESLDACAAELTPPVPLQLQHYLQRRSYDKALAFLEEASFSG